MSGLPPIPYDPGVICPACFLMDQVTPARFMLNFTDIQLEFTPQENPNVIIFAEQSISEPCFYSGFDETELFEAMYWYHAGPGVETTSGIFLHISGVPAFMANFSNACTLRGQVYNEIHQGGSPPNSYFGGRAIIQPF